MYMLASFDCKFKSNRENIENIFQHYGLRKIQSSLYAGNLNNDERKDLCENISKIIREYEYVDNSHMSELLFKKGNMRQKNQV